LWPIKTNLCLKKARFRLAGFCVLATYALIPQLITMAQEIGGVA
jgi:hypothetical protein